MLICSLCFLAATLAAAADGFPSKSCSRFARSREQEHDYEFGAVFRV
jgi:hypothetical protein